MLENLEMASVKFIRMLLIVVQALPDDVERLMPEDRDLLDKVVEAIFHFHSYQEPVIRVMPVLTSWSKGTNQSGNPHRWWNKGGDGKKKAVAEGD